MKHLYTVGLASLLLILPVSVNAQFVGGVVGASPEEGLVIASDGTGTGVSIPAAYTGTPVGVAGNWLVANLVAVIQITLVSSTACSTVASTGGVFTVIPNTTTSGAALCQVLFSRVLTNAEAPPYAFTWTGSLAYNYKEYILANVSGVIDVASQASGNAANTATASSITTTVIGDYLMAFFVNSDNPTTWTPPSGMGIATKNLDAPPSSYFNLTMQSWASAVGATGTVSAPFTGAAGSWVANLVAFKPLYAIPVQTVGDLNPGPGSHTTLSWMQSKSVYQTLTSSANATPVNAALGDNCYENLVENTLIGAPTNPLDGQTLTFLFTNNATPEVVTWNAIFHFVGGTAPTITASKDSVVAFKYNATKTQWNELYRALNQ